MSRPTFAAYRDRDPTDDVTDVGPAPLPTASVCKTPGCNALWTVGSNKGGGHCSVHAWARPATDPTSQQAQDGQRDRADLAIARGRMRIGTSEPKAWAHRLKARELAGERLTMLQSKAWREALSLRGTKSDVDDTS